MKQEKSVWVENELWAGSLLSTREASAADRVRDCPVGCREGVGSAGCLPVRPALRPSVTMLC